jgi:hypothetical protein
VRALIGGTTSWFGLRAATSSSMGLLRTLRRLRGKVSPSHSRQIGRRQAVRICWPKSPMPAG